MTDSIVHYAVASVICVPSVLGFYLKRTVPKESKNSTFELYRTDRNETL